MEKRNYGFYKEQVISKNHGYYYLGRFYTKEKAISYGLVMILGTLIFSLLLSNILSFAISFFVEQKVKLICNVFLPIFLGAGLGGSTYTIQLLKKQLKNRDLESGLEYRFASCKDIYDRGVENSFSTILSIFFCLIEIVFADHIVWSAIWTVIGAILFTIHIYKGVYVETKEKDKLIFLLASFVFVFLILVRLKNLGYVSVIPAPIGLLVSGVAISKGYDSEMQFWKKYFGGKIKTYKAYEYLSKDFDEADYLQELEKSVQKAAERIRKEENEKGEVICGQWYPKKWKAMTTFEREIVQRIAAQDYSKKQWERIVQLSEENKRRERLEKLNAASGNKSKPKKEATYYTDHKTERKGNDRFWASRRR